MRKVRETILDTAKECVCKDRNDSCGEPEDRFGQIAKFWTAYKNVPFEPQNVAIMMALLKIARVQAGTGGLDSFIDIAGYAVCGGEIAAKIWKNNEEEA